MAEYWRGATLSAPKGAFSRMHICLARFHNVIDKCSSVKCWGIKQIVIWKSGSFRDRTMPCPYFLHNLRQVLICSSLIYLRWSRFQLITNTFSDILIFLYLIKTYLPRITHQPKAVLHEVLLHTTIIACWNKNDMTWHDITWQRKGNLDKRLHAESLIESDKTTSIYNVSTRVLSKK